MWFAGPVLLNITTLKDIYKTNFVFDKFETAHPQPQPFPPSYQSDHPAQEPRTGLHPTPGQQHLLPQAGRQDHLRPGLAPHYHAPHKLWSARFY